MNLKNTKKPTDVTKLTVVPQPVPYVSLFNRLIDEWLVACRATGLAEKTRTEYRAILEKFYWWWSEYTHYNDKLGDHPSFVTRKEAREFVVYVREPNKVPGRALLPGR